MEQHIDHWRQHNSKHLEDINERLTFHPRAASNVIISRSGRTAERKNSTVETGFGGLATVRPLKDEEIFRVQVENTMDFWGGYSIGIGVTTIPANLMDYPPWMALSRPDNWMVYFCEGWPGLFCFYYNGRELSKQFGIRAIQIKVGDQLCVQKKLNGNIHFYLNNILLGKALLNLTQNIYGIVDIHGNVDQVSIID